MRQEATRFCRFPMFCSSTLSRRHLLMSYLPQGYLVHLAMLDLLMPLGLVMREKSEPPNQQPTTPFYVHHKTICSPCSLLMTAAARDVFKLGTSSHIMRNQLVASVSTTSGALSFQWGMCKARGFASGSVHTILTCFNPCRRAERVVNGRTPYSWAAVGAPPTAWHGACHVLRPCSALWLLHDAAG